MRFDLFRFFSGPGTCSGSEDELVGGMETDNDDAEEEMSANIFSILSAAFASSSIHFDRLSSSCISFLSSSSLCCSSSRSNSSARLFFSSSSSSSSSSDDDDDGEGTDDGGGGVNDSTAASVLMLSSKAVEELGWKKS